MELTNCDTCQRTKWSNAKYETLQAKECEGIRWNKLCVYLIGPYIIRRKGNKETVIIKSITTIDSVTGWFEITQYDDKK